MSWMDKNINPNKKVNLSRNDWLDYLAWRIEAEKNSLSFSGISLWLILAAIGICIDKIFSIIKVYGINDLLSYSFFDMISICLLLMFVFSWGMRKLTRRYKRLNPEKSKKSIDLIDVWITVTALILLLLISTKSNGEKEFTAIIHYASYLILITYIIFISVVDVNSSRRIIIPFIGNKIIIRILNKRFFNNFFVSELIFIIITLILIFVKIYNLNFSIYSTVKGTDFFYFNILVSLIIILLYWVAKLSYDKNKVYYLIEKRDMIFFGYEIILEALKSDLIMEYYGLSVNDACNGIKVISPYLGKPQRILHSLKSSIKKINYFCKNEKKENYIEIKSEIKNVNAKIKEIKAHFKNKTNKLFYAVDLDNDKSNYQAELKLNEYEKWIITNSTKYIEIKKEIKSLKKLVSKASTKIKKIEKNEDSKI